jgi:hypothetical protein
MRCKSIPEGDDKNTPIVLPLQHCPAVAVANDSDTDVLNLHNLTVHKLVQRLQ